ncbi:PfkB family carbohydrate kinase [Georgenia halophila]|uniref:PfkB family carbohydrate kinase n=1 Tax=Georgenia halophila TaxID=620889 RepID=A0ABP8LBW0_9MICO
MRGNGTTGNGTTGNVTGIGGARLPRVVLVGDVMLDRDVDGRSERLSPDGPVPVVDVSATRESPGGAGLAALLCAERGARVTLVAPVADDEPGRRLAERLRRDLTLVALPHQGDTRTKTRVRSGGQSLVRVDGGGPGTPGELPLEEVRSVLDGADLVLVSDYGAGVTRDDGLRALLAEAATSTPLVWDPHPKGGEPVPGAFLVTPNVSEARAGAPDDTASPDLLATDLLTRWQAAAVCVTAGEEGAYLVRPGNEPVFFPAAAADGDPCGAGDQLVASAAVALAGGAPVTQALEQAVADASAWVAAGGADGFRYRLASKDAARTNARVDGSTGDGMVGDGRTADGVTGDGGAGSTALRGRPWSADPAALDRLVARLRGDGGTLVATGGCFDIVHAGHVATLEAARRLGDHLVVVMNSDPSVARLKGPGRPVVPAADRARVLEALDCVDAVVVFDEDDPRAVLDRMRPDVWAKGGDYTAPLPEAEIVRRRGGRVVVLPFLDGRSTTSIIQRSGLARARSSTGRSTA